MYLINFVQEQCCYRRHQQAVCEEDPVLVARTSYRNLCWPDCSFISVDSVSDSRKRYINYYIVVGYLVILILWWLYWLQAVLVEFEVINCFLYIISATIYSCSVDWFSKCVLARHHVKGSILLNLNNCQFPGAFHPGFLRICCLHPFGGCLNLCTGSNVAIFILTIEWWPLGSKRSRSRWEDEASNRHH